MAEYDGRIRVPFVVKKDRYFPMVKGKRVICVHESNREKELADGALDCEVVKTPDGRFYAKVPVKFQLQMECMREAA